MAFSNRPHEVDGNGSSRRLFRPSIADFKRPNTHHARNNGKSSKVSVQTPTSTFSYVGSVCSGSYTTAAGTTVYVVGRQTSFAGTGFGAPYHGYSIHKGGPMGADFSWVSSFASLAAAQAACANPAVSLPTPFALDAASVRFKV